MQTMEGEELDAQKQWRSRDLGGMQACLNPTYTGPQGGRGIITEFSQPAAQSKLIHVAHKWIH